jgi:peptide/nickel transport system ATP-binding protein
VQECGDVDQVLDAPTHAYTRALLAASARRDGQTSDARRDATAVATPLLEIRGLSAGYGRIGRDGNPAVCVLDDVNLSIPRGSALGVIGESGSGKTTLARVVSGLVERAGGDVLFEGQPLSSSLSGRTADQYRRIQLVFQNADTALNPSHTVEEILGRPLAFYMGLRGAEAKRRIAELLDLVKLPASTASRRPGGLSGGQKQRVNFARALAAEPSLILCDEVTSALDTVVGAAILELLRELRVELGVSYLFISHDISTVRAVCDDVIVLYAGRCVEAAQPRLLDQPPHHPYTGLLVDSVPALKRGWLDARRNMTACALPPLSEGTDGAELCSFRARCSARIEGKCNAVRPPLRKLPSGAQILCHRSAEELKLLQPLRGAA